MKAGTLTYDNYVKMRNPASSDCILESRAVTLGTERNADFFSTAGNLILTLEGTISDPFIYNTRGTTNQITTRPTLTLIDDAHNFIWIDSDGVLGRSDLPCYYTYVPPATVVDQHWFSLNARRMKRWDGAAWANVDRLFIGYVRTDAGVANPRYNCEKLMDTPYTRFAERGDAADGFLDMNGGSLTDNGTKRYAAIVARNNATITTVYHNEKLPFHYVQGCVTLLNSHINMSGKGPAPITNGATAAGTTVASTGGGGQGGGGGRGTAGNGGNNAAATVENARRGTLRAAVAGGTAGSRPGGAGNVAVFLKRHTRGIALLLVQHGGPGANAGSSAATATPRAFGGYAGGAFFLACGSLALDVTSTITCKGLVGDVAPAVGHGGGGGGGGAVSEIDAGNIFDDNGATFLASGGLGGVGGNDAVNTGPGGVGAAGIIRKERLVA